MMLANHAEVPPGMGLIYVSGGGWDTVTIGAPTGDEGVAGVLRGSVAIRLLLEPSEAEDQHGFTISVLSDELLVAQLGGGFGIENAPDAPPGWPLGVPLAIQFAGLPVPSFGIYVLRLEVADEILGETQFRVIKGY